MKKFNFLAVLITAILFTSNLSAQNIVLNGSFENLSANYYGSPGSFDIAVDDWVVGCNTGSPDVYSPTATSCLYNVPTNWQSVNRPAIFGSNYCGFSIGQYESILGKFTNSLNDCSYEVSFAYAPRGNSRTCPSNYTWTPVTQTTQLEIVLRNSNNPCAGGTVVYTTPVLDISPNTQANWQTITGSFSLTQAQINAGYDRFEVRSVNGAGGYIFLDNFSISPNCCPTELELDVNCERGEISVVNLPQGSTVTSTIWKWKKKILGMGTVFLSGPVNYSTITAQQGNGYYMVTMTITLANGTECEVTGMTFYSDDDCCQITHPDGLQAWVAANNNVIGYQTIAACGTTFNVPIICNKSREYSFDISLCPNIDGYSIFNGHFDPNTCADINTLYSLAGSGTIPSTITLNASQYELGELNNFTIYATDPGLNPTSQSINILYIPHNPDLCGGQLGKSLNLIDENLEVSTTELKISAIHPNPANNFTTVSLNKLASGTVGIYAMDGRELTSVSFEDQREVTLSTTDLPNGMYIVKLIVNNQTITKKLIKE